LSGGFWWHWGRARLSICVMRATRDRCAGGAFTIVEILVVIATIAILMAILLPAIEHARHQAYIDKCASNLRQIGQAMLLYANENKGKYPREMGELLLTQDITVEVFVNPETKTKAPRNKNKEDQAAWVSKDSDYEYLGAGKNNQAGPDVVLAHEKMRPGAQGVNMLYGDGHVEWNVLSAAEQTLTRQRAADMKMKKGGQ